MTPSLSRWISDADAFVHLSQLRATQTTLEYDHVTSRFSDYYVALVGELFHGISSALSTESNWAKLGNAFSQIGGIAFAKRARTEGVSPVDAHLFAAAAYYCGGYSASAYITARELTSDVLPDELSRATYDLLARPINLYSETASRIREAIREGKLEELAALEQGLKQQSQLQLSSDSYAWVHARILERIVSRFVSTNIRSVLPDGASKFWTPLVQSFLNRSPPTWEFFPSQIQAIREGLLTSKNTYSLQMPTGAGKTTLCETLLFAHATANAGQASVLLVPYRSLASELRLSLVRYLNGMGVRARCAYGGTVPAGDEVQQLDDTKVLVATPESLSGLIGANPDFFQRISLVICDEGHLLDGGARGIGLELLLARMKVRASGAPRFVFVSAIVPNIEEINAWLGGVANSVVRSDYRPSIAEFSFLQEVGKGASAAVDLVMHPHEDIPTRYVVSQFLSRTDFEWFNTTTRRQNVYGFGSIKSRAIGAMRKLLPLGTVAVFAANKHGNQGCVGLAEELANELSHDLTLPKPSDWMNSVAVGPTLEYLVAEYGDEWAVTTSIRFGVVVHHGDIPQETRELLEQLLRKGHIRAAICTSTLAEGVNLPIRSLVLYSVQRMGRDGKRENLLARDIKNLVGRAGQFGATTKGLVVCANGDQWPIVASVARHGVEKM